MKLKDIVFITCCIAFFLPFFVVKDVYSFYVQYNKEHGMIMSFIKFAVLGTLGEVIGLRIKTANYSAPGFGIVPRAVIWGFLGLTIALAFKIFSAGAPVFLAYMGIENAPVIIKGDLSPMKILVAFTISVTMNLIYAPVLMTLHKITDEHIIRNGGTMNCLLKPIQMEEIFATINWRVQWSFVFKKTIPLFWIPAHTVTFLLPPEFQVLFAAILGIVLGVLMATASLLSRSN